MVTNGCVSDCAHDQVPKQLVEFFDPQMLLRIRLIGNRKDEGSSKASQRRLSLIGTDYRRVPFSWEAASWLSSVRRNNSASLALYPLLFHLCFRSTAAKELPQERLRPERSSARTNQSIQCFLSLLPVSNRVTLMKREIQTFIRLLDARAFFRVCRIPLIELALADFAVRGVL